MCFYLIHLIFIFILYWYINVTPPSLPPSLPQHKHPLSPPPIHLAGVGVQVDVVRVLLEAGADAEVRDDRGHTVLDTIALINTPITQEITNLIKCTAPIPSPSDLSSSPYSLVSPHCVPFSFTSTCFVSVLL